MACSRWLPNATVRWLLNDKSTGTPVTMPHAAQGVGGKLESLEVVAT